MENLGQRIRQLRKWRGLSQSELEATSGIKREYLSKLENSELKNPTFNTLLKISSALGIPLTSLIENIDKPLTRDEPVIKVIKEQGGRSKKGLSSAYYAVPIIGEDLAATNPLYLGEQDIISYAVIPVGWLEKKDVQTRYRCLQLDKRNTAMRPLLNPGAIVCYDIQQTNPYKLQQQLAVIRDREAKAVVRTLNLGNEYIVAVPQHAEEYPLIVFPLDRESQILGKVIWYINQT